MATRTLGKGPPPPQIFAPSVTFGNSSAVYAEGSDSSGAPIRGRQDDATGPMVDLRNRGNGKSAIIDASGNLAISGKIFTEGSCSAGCVVTRSTAGREITTYSTRGPVPSIEDFGQGTLVGGTGRVTINPDFASVTDPRYGHLVFITPKGDNRGLFVANETTAGFTVRESQGGRSTLAFDYRIVAKPFASNEARLPVYHPAEVPFADGLRHSSATFTRPSRPPRP